MAQGPPSTLAVCTCRSFVSAVVFWLRLLILRGQIFQAAYWNCDPQSQCALMKGLAYWGF